MVDYNSNNTRGTSSVGSSSATPFTSNYTSCDIPSNHPIDPELQSVGDYTTSPYLSNSTFVDQNTTTSHHSFHPHPVGFQVGCQTEFDPPSLEVKEQKKLALPNFDPSKTSWHNFSMKLHAALIEHNMDYLLSEPATNGFNYAHSKELIV